MNIENLDLNLLRLFDAIWRRRSVSQAAEELGLSQPAASQALSRLRHQLGDVLFHRAPGGVQPTPRADQLAAAIQSALSLLEGALEAPADQFRPRESRRVFRLHLSDIGEARFLPALMALLRREAPLTRIETSPLPQPDIAPALHAGRIDLYISARRAFAPDIKLQHLFSSSFVGIARSDHPIFDGPINLDSFTEHEHISVSRRGLARGPFDTALAERGYARRVSLITPNFQSAIFAVADSRLLLPLMPAPLLPIVERLGLKLRQFPLPIPVDNVDVFQAWHPRLDHDHAHRWLRRMIKELCTGSDPCGSDPGI